MYVGCGKGEQVTSESFSLACIAPWLAQAPCTCWFSVEPLLQLN